MVNDTVPADGDGAKATNSYDQIGSRCEFKTHHTVPNKEGKLRVKAITDPFDHENRTASENVYALVINREFTIEDPTSPKSVTLKINSPHLLKSFRNVVKSYPAVPSEFTTPFELTSPFQMLIHYWEELEKYRDEVGNGEARMHLNLLLQFMEHEVGPEREKLLAMVNDGKITYLTAWALFRPGDLVYTTVMKQPWLLRCERTAYEESTSIGPYFEVHCTYTDHDGRVAGMAKHKVLLLQKKHFGGGSPAKIVSLPIFPRKYIHREDIEVELSTRGKRFLELHQCQGIQEYDGLAQYLREPPSSFWHWDMDNFDPVWLPFTETGRIVLDRATFIEDLSSKIPAVEIGETEPELCPPFAMGYSLGKKEWCQFLIDNIHAVKWKQKVWENLILEEEQKTVLKALVTSHRYADNPRDQPEQKGKGLVILLHGSPGSGKTLSAESSAELTRKALISTSIAGLDPEGRSYIFEKNLRRLLLYATMWKAIVLLDEADVFLEAREEKAGNAERNALVAIFLKELEYFSGIIFLTTNRVGTFDAAMKSRIHLALGFSPPVAATRHQLWVHNLTGVPQDEQGIEDIDFAGRHFAVRSLNGREISNVVNTARTLATHEGNKLQLRHIETVLKVRDSFDKSLKAEKKRLMSQSETKGHQLVRRDSILTVTEEPDEYNSD
ncbi:P-loop containing nucleoside triphosphate hydrolase protein [Xylariaceae sp. FL0255]|nr:P-loop containing nucleoside triphosphate hydrolase protein [Xylariaceae sp. FL0255]